MSSANSGRALPTTVEQLGLDETPRTAGPDDPLVRHLRVAIDTQLRQLLERQEGLRRRNEPEDVHQLRVAVRRMRAVLREQGAVLGERGTWLRAELKWLASSFGEVRDLDVLIDGLAADAAQLPERDAAAFGAVLTAFGKQRTEARKRAMRTLRTARYRKLLYALAETASHGSAYGGTEDDGTPEPPGTDPSGTQTRGATPGELIRKPYRKLRKDVRAAGAEPTDDQLHALRLRGKRLRYSAEFSHPKGNKETKRVRALIKAAKSFQTLLGDHNDLVVADERLRALLAEEKLDTEAVLACGRLLERRAHARARYRDQWRAAWATLDKRARALL